MVPGILYLIDLDQRDVKACYKCLKCYFSHSTVLVLDMVLVILVYGFNKGNLVSLFISCIDVQLVSNLGIQQMYLLSSSQERLFHK